LLACGVSAVGAQERPSRRAEPELERFAVGVRMGFALTDLIKGGQTRDFINTIDGPIIVTTDAESPTKRFAIGPTFQANITRKIGFNVDFLYRSDIRFTTAVTVDRDPDADGMGIFDSSREVRTKANYWDIPIMVRYYVRPPGGARFFFTGGIALRTVTGEEATLILIDEDFLREEMSVPADVANKTVAGVSGGVGIQLVDDIGIKVGIEGRFTRWGKRNFAMGLANSNQNQIEVTLGFSY
jgi:opacity protein-like surface antigen